MSLKHGPRMRILALGFASTVAALCLSSHESYGQTISLSNQSTFFGAYGTTTGPTGTHLVKFVVSGSPGTVVDWCAVDPFHAGTTPGGTATIASGGSVTVSTSALPIGYYDLYVAPSSTNCQATGFVTASVAVIRKNTTLVDTRFGVNLLGGVNLTSTNYISTTLPQIAGAMLDAGFGATRDQLYWKQLEKTVGNYCWQTSAACGATTPPAGTFASLFNTTYASFGLNLLILGFGNSVTSPPYTASNTTPPTPAAGLAGFDNYVAALMAPLSGTPGKIDPSLIGALDVWNEFNGDNSLYCDGCLSDPTLRGPVYQTLSSSVPGSAGGAQLVLGATAGVGLPWWYIGQPVSSSTSGTLDMHPYSSTADTLQPDLVDFATYVNSGLGSRNVWATEFAPSYSSVAPTDPNYEFNLAGYPAKAAAIMLNNGVTNAFWFPAADNPNFTANDTRSLLRGDATLTSFYPSPSFVAFDTLIRQLSGFTADPTFNHTAGTGDRRVHAYHFKKGTNNLYIIWMSSGSATVSFAAGTPTGMDAVGKSVTLPATLSNDLPIFVSGTSTLSAPTITPSDTFLADSVDDFALDVAPAGCSGSGIICGTYPTVTNTEPAATSLNNWQYGNAGSGTVSTTNIVWSADLTNYYWGAISGPIKLTRTGQSPGTNPAAREWTAPAGTTGSISISGHFRDTSGSSSNGMGVLVGINKNGSQIWPTIGGSPLAIGNHGYATFNVTGLSVTAGDKITFVTSQNVSSTDQHSELAAYISH